MEFDFVWNFHLWLYMVTITYTAPRVDETLFKHSTIINLLSSFFLIYFIFKLYITVLVLPNI